MARPMTGKTPKKNMCLTVSEQTRAELTFISEHYNESVSSLLAQWAEKEAQEISKRTGAEIPQIDQTVVKE